MVNNMLRIISNSDDIIDSRDVIERIDDIEEMLPSVPGEVMPGTSGEIEELREELRALKELASDAADYAPDWSYGEQLIRDTYFQDYAEELAEDLGSVDHQAIWPMNCIDWERAARELQMDYSAIEFDGVTYWIR